MTLDFSKPPTNIPGLHYVEAPNGRAWVWDGLKWELTKEAHLKFTGEDPVKVGTYTDIHNGISSVGIKTYLDTTDLDDLPS